MSGVLILPEMPLIGPEQAIRTAPPEEDPAVEGLDQIGERPSPLECDVLCPFNEPHLAGPGSISRKQSVTSGERPMTMRTGKRRDPVKERFWRNTIVDQVLGLSFSLDIPLSHNGSRKECPRCPSRAPGPTLTIGAGSRPRGRLEPSSGSSGAGAAEAPLARGVGVTAAFPLSPGVAAMPSSTAAPAPPRKKPPGRREGPEEIAPACDRRSASSHDGRRAARPVVSALHTWAARPFASRGGGADGPLRLPRHRSALQGSSGPAASSACARSHRSTT